MAVGFAQATGDALYYNDSVLGIDVNTLSMACLFRVTTANTVGSLICTGSTVSAGNGSVFLQTALSGAKFRLRVQRLSDATTGVWNYNVDLDLNTWYQVAIKYNKFLTTNDPRMWVNGLEITLTESVTPTGTATVSVDSLVIGANVSLASNLTGEIAEVGIWNRMLDDVELVSASNGYSPLCFPSGLKVYLPLRGEEISAAGLMWFQQQATIATSGSTVFNRTHPRIYIPDAPQYGTYSPNYKSLSASMSVDVSMAATLTAYRSLSAACSVDVSCSAVTTCSRKLSAALSVDVSMAAVISVTGDYTTLEEGLAAFLTSKEDLPPVHAVRVPLDATLPAMSYYRVTGGGAHHLTAGAGYGRATIQIDIYATTSKEAKQIGRTVRRYLQGYTGDMEGHEVWHISQPTEIELPEQGATHLACTYEVLHVEPAIDLANAYTGEDETFVEVGLVEYLTAELEVSLYAQGLPFGETVAMPCIYYGRLDATYENTFDGSAGYGTERYSFQCIGHSMEEAVTLGEALRRALQGFQGTLSGASIWFAQYESQAQAYIKPSAGQRGRFIAELTFKLLVRDG